MDGPVVTEADLARLEASIRSRVRRTGQLTAADATALRLVDWYRETQGWNDKEEGHDDEAGAD